MPGHQRRFSDSLVLEEDDKGSVLVSRINPDLSASQGLQEGDKIVGATIHFDRLTKNEVVEILKLIEPYDDKVQMLAHQDKGYRKSKSLESLDRIKAPDEIHKDSYHKLFNAKVKKFMKENTAGRNQENAASSVRSHDKAKNDITNINNLDSVVDLKKVDVAACLQKVERREKPLKTAKSFDNVGPLEFQNDITDYINTPEVSGNYVKTLSKTNAYTPSVSVQNCNMDINSDTHMSDSITRPGKLPETPDLITAVPDLSTDEKTPNVNLMGAMPDFDHEVNYTGPDGRADVSVGKVLNKKNTQSKVKTPKVNIHGVSEQKYNSDLLQQSSDLTQTDEVRVPELDEYNSHLVSGQTKMNQARVTAPDLNIDATSKYRYSPELLLQSLKVSKTRKNVDASESDIGHFKVGTGIIDLDSSKADFESNQKYGHSGSLRNGSDLEDLNPVGMTDTHGVEFGHHNANLKGPKLEAKTPDININSPTGKLKTPKLKMPKLNFKSPDTGVKGDLQSPDLRMSSANLDSDVCAPDIEIGGNKIDLKGPKTSLLLPDMDLASGNVKTPKFNMPDFGLLGTKAKASDIDLSLPHMKGEITSPDLTGPELKAGRLKSKNFKKPSINVEVPDIDTDELNPNIPKFGITGSLPKGPSLKVKGDVNAKDMDLSDPKLNAEIKSPEFNIKGHKPDFNIETNNDKIQLKKPKTDIETPNFDLDLDAPKLDVKTTDLNIPSPTGKIKMSKTNIETPDFDMSAPSGKPKMSKFGLSGSLPKGPDFKGPKIKGEIDAQNTHLTLPEADLKTPNLDMTTQNIDIDSSSGKIKMPKFKKPKFSLSGFKGPSTDLAGPDLSASSHVSPEFGAPDIGIDGPKTSLKGIDLKGPKIKGGIDSPDMNLVIPESNMKGPKLHIKSPDIESPSETFKMPKFKIPGFKGANTDIKGGLKQSNLSLTSPKLDTEIHAPDIDGPDLKVSKPRFTFPDNNLPSSNVNMPRLKMPDLGLSGSNVKVPEMDFSTPNVDIQAPEFESDVPSGKMKIPKFGFSGNLPKGPDLKGPKFKGGINGKDINLTLPESDLKTPDMDYNSPDIGIDGPGGKFKVPKFKTPKFSIPGFKGPKANVKGDMKNPDLSLSSPRLDGDISSPDIRIDGPNLKSSKPGLKLPDVDLPSGSINMPRLKMPNLGLSGPDVKTPEMDLSAGKIKGEISSPDFVAPDVNVDIPSGKIKGPSLKSPNVDIQAPEFDTDVPSGKLKMPKFGFSGNLPKSPTLKVPKLKGGIDTPNMDLALSKPDLDGPDLNVKSPNMDIDGPSRKLKLPTFKIPSLGHSGPKVKAPEMDISGPTFTGDINTPDWNIKGPKTNLTAPEFDGDIHVGKMKVPSLKTPNVDIQAPEFDTDVPSGKLKMPKFGFSGNLPKGPDLKGPKFKGGINGKDINLTLPESDLNTPNLDYNSPDIDIDGPRGKFKVPKFKTPKFSIPGFKGPKANVKGDMKNPDLSLSSPRLDGDISNPDMRIDGPNLKSSKPGLKLPDVDLPSGSINMPRLKMPNLGLSGPNVKTPEMDLSAGKIKGEISSPDFVAPDVNVDIPSGKIKGPSLKSPNVDIQAPEFNTDVPSGKLKMPKFGFSGNLPKSPTLKVPKLKGGIDTPNMDLALSKPDLDGPDLNVKSPNMDIDGPSRKLKLPTFKIPSLGHSGPKVKAPEMDISGPTFTGDINTPDWNIKGPKTNLTAPEFDGDIHVGKMKVPSLKTPNVDIQAPEFDTDVPSGKLKMPKFGFSGNLPKSPTLKVPKLKGGIDTPNIDLALSKSDLEGPDLNMKSPNMDIDGPSRKLKLPTFKIPSLGHSGPKVKAPEMNISGPTFTGDINTPDWNIKGPKTNLTAPGFDGDIQVGKMKVPSLKTPNVDNQAPEFDTDVPSGKLKMPKFGFSGNLPKGPDLKGPKFKGGINGKDINLTLPESDLKTPDMDYNSPDIGIDGPGGKFKVPKFKTPKFSIPGLKGPKTNVKGDMKYPDLSLSSPRLDGDISSPDIKIDGPNFKSSKPGLKLSDVDLPSGSVNMPRLKMPNLGLSGPNVKTPEMDLSAGKIKGEISSPDFVAPDVNVDIPSGKIKGPSLKSPNVDIQASGFDTDVPSGKLKMPKFGFSGNLPKSPTLKVPKLKGGIDTPNMDLALSKPDLEGPDLNVKSPDMDIDGPSRKLKMPTFKIPSLGHSGPKVKAPEKDISGPTFTGDMPDWNIKGPKPNLTFPELDADIHTCKITSPDVDIDGPEGKINMPRLKAPNFNIPGLMDPNLKVKRGSLGTDLNLSPPKLNAELSGHDINVDGPKTDLQGLKSDLNLPHMDMPSGKVNIPKFKMPDFGLSGPKIKSSEMDLSPPTIKGEINTDAALGNLKMPEFGLSGTNIKGPSVKGGTDHPDINLLFPKSDMKGPKLDVNSPEPDISGLGGKLKPPRFKPPKFSVPEFKEPDCEVEGNVILSSPKFDAEVRDAKLDTQADLRGPKTDLTHADYDLSSSKLDLGLSNAKLPNVKGKEEFSSLGINAPSIDSSIPTTKVKAESIRNKTHASVKLPKDSLLSDLDLDVPKGTLKKSKLKLLTIV